MAAGRRPFWNGWVAAGSRFQPGQSIQIGWSLARFVSLPSGALGLEEPDMKSFPIVHRPGLTRTLRHLRLQRDTLGSLEEALTPAFPPLTQACMVCSELAPDKGLRMHRFAPSASHSGWLMTCRDASHDHGEENTLRVVSLYQAILQICPRALAFLAFPTGSTVVADDELSFHFDGKPVAVRTGSFLDWRQRQAGDRLG